MPYVIQNCPCIKHSDEIELDNRCMSTQDDKLFFCENNIDCLLKRIVEKCKNLDYRSKDLYDLGKTNMALDIIGLLDIQEVE